MPRLMLSSLSGLPYRNRRTSALLTTLLTLLMGAASAKADVIYLKNGQKIVATVTREDSKQIVYERGGGEFAIPRSLVDRVERSPTRPDEVRSTDSSSRANRKLDLPLPSGPALEETAQPRSQVIKGSAIDEPYLQHLDAEFLRNPTAQNRRLLVRGYQEAAIFLTRKGDPEAAIEEYRHALKFAPDDLGLTLALGYLLVKQNHHEQTIDLLSPAALRNPKIPDIPLLLGSAYYAIEKLDRAVEEWKKALAIAENPRLRQALARAERERDVAAAYLELRSEHFLLRCESRGVKTLGEEVLRTLEAAFRELELDLDVYPAETVVVSLYPDQQFRDITRSPSWVSALNDGKIRLPVSGLSTVTLDLARVLKHELTHSFVRQVTLGRCPVWFNEGLAQLEEGGTLAGLRPQLARAFRNAPAYSALESSFIGMPEGLVGVAYAKSLAGAEYLRETYGLGEIRLLLKLISKNPNFSSLLESELRLTYPALDDAVTAYVEKRYGSQ